MIKFDTTKETHVKGVVATLAQLYRGEPVGSVQIGASYGMSHHQVLIYLHAAREDNLATPVYSNAGGIIAA